MRYILKFLRILLMGILWPTIALSMVSLMFLDSDQKKLLFLLWKKLISFMLTSFLHKYFFHLFNIFESSCVFCPHWNDLSLSLNERINIVLEFNIPCKNELFYDIGNWSPHRDAHCLSLQVSRCMSMKEKSPYIIKVTICYQSKSDTIPLKKCNVIQGQK